MPENIALALIANRITELAPELRSDLAAAINAYTEWFNDNHVSIEESQRFTRLRALYDALTVEPHEPDPRD